MEAVPGARRMAALSDPTFTPAGQVQTLQNAARARGVELMIFTAAAPNEIFPAIEGQDVGRCCIERTVGSHVDLSAGSASAGQGAPRRQAGRPAGRAADQIRSGDQSQDRQGARPHRPADFARARRQGDRMNAAMSLWPETEVSRRPRYDRDQVESGPNSDIESRYKLTQLRHST